MRRGKTVEDRMREGMKIVDEKTFKETKVVKVKKKGTALVSKKEMTEMMKSFDKPVELQKEVAMKIKAYIEERIEVELEEKKVLTESTRKWVEIYNSLLDKIHKNIYGDKSTHINVKVSHKDITRRIRKHMVKDLKEVRVIDVGNVDESKE